jgi:creatinine amidohydrolase/Fe(II)-dependent formamide hydrolase-like protein
MNHRFATHIATALLAFATCAQGQVPSSVMLDELTWTELKQQIATGRTTIIVPIGGTEQNGPYMALGKHNARVRALAEKIARELGNALVAPVIAYAPEGNVDPPTEHMRFPGTITIPDKTFEQLLESAARSFKLHGFRDVVFLGDHGGYQKDLRNVADRLNREWSATPVRAHAVVEYYRVTTGTYVDALKGRGYSADEIGTHAGVADTSLTLALTPGMVRTDRLAAAPKPGASDGVYGDPRRSNADVGQLGVDAIVTATVAAIRKATARH